ncbi:MAG: hypothetical protein LBC45_06240 [Chlamydiales bacterium]|jgi:hypothetical protein|nr:hypothetical protein [Chlamydiales bacterium]
MSVSMNPVSSIHAEEIQKMNFLGSQISNIFREGTDKTIQLTELAKELLGLKKETSQATEVALLASKYGSFIGEKPLKLFAMSLNKLSLNPLEVGLAYMQKAPGYDPVKGFQVPDDWGENEMVTLNQIYKEQFFAWILINSELPFDSILNMLPLLKGFDDQSIQLKDDIWDKSLPTEKRQKQLKEFQSKYEFLMENKFLYSFPIELEKIKVMRDLQKPIYRQDELIDKIFEWLFTLLLEKTQSTNTRRILVNSLEGLSERKVSKKLFVYKLKKTLPFLQNKLGYLMEHFEGDKTPLEENKARLKELEESQVEIEKVLEICREKKEKISSQAAKDGRKTKPYKGEFKVQDIIKEVTEQYNELKKQGVDSIERDAQVNRRLHRILKEKMIALKHVQATEAYFTGQNRIFEKQKRTIQQKISTSLNLLKEELSCVRFLVNHIETGIARALARWKEERLKLSINQFDEILEKEFVAECKIPSSKVPKCRQKPLDSSEDEEEEPVALFEQLVSASTHASAPLIYTDEQMQSYLSDKAKNKQLNGALSQSVESILQQIQPYLYRTQGEEVYNHALLGAAALEQMVQAIYEGRRNHIVLGFRSSLIHCHFATEQILSQEIFRKIGKTIDSHNLTVLANTLAENTQTSFSEKDQEFLKEIRVYLWFHYPEDYRLYFAHNKAIPKAFSLLETLSQPGITKENVQEAMEFSFEKYYQTLEFITKLSGAPSQKFVELFKNRIDDLQKHLHAADAEPKELSANGSSLIYKMDRVLEKLACLDQLIHMKDFEEGWLFAIFDTMKSYVQLMKSSLETPQVAMKHSLQKFIQVETLFNMDRLFKNLFRAVSFLHLGGDTRMHSLDKFYSVIQEFYKEPLSKEDRNVLKSINLSITHHYFHKKSHADLKSTYSHFLDKARALLSVNDEFPHVATKDGNISAMDLQKQIEEEGQMMQTMHKSLDLLIQLLDPVIGEMQKIHNDIEKNLINRLQIG